MTFPELSGSQCRAARSLLLWSEGDLSVISGVSAISIAHFEAEGAIPLDLVHAISRSFESVGVEFTHPDRGIRISGSALLAASDVLCHAQRKH